MINYEGGTTSFNDTISIPEETDLVRPLENNTPITRIHQNVRYLRERLSSYEGVLRIDMNIGDIPPNDANLLNTYDWKNKFIIINQTGTNITAGTTIMQLPSADSVPIGTVIPITNTWRSGSDAIAIVAAMNNTLTITDKAYSYLYTLNPAWTGFGGTQPTEKFPGFYLHGGETAYVMRHPTSGSATNKWMLIGMDGNIDRVGEQMFGYQVKRGMLIRKGDELPIWWYPRLFTMAYNDANIKVAKSDWLAYPSKRGFFGLPTTSSIASSPYFQLPQDDGMFERALSYGATYEGGEIIRDVNRYYATPGSEATKPGNYQAGASITAVAGGTGAQGIGGDEVKPVNVGKIPLIIY